ncbi:hypothetical protein PAMP_015016 [Pampus punctatissimus]
MVDFFKSALPPQRQDSFVLHDDTSLALPAEMTSSDRKLRVNQQVNGLGFTNHSLPINGPVQRPFRRVEVSPPPSPELPRSRFAYNTHFGTNTLPGTSQSFRMGAVSMLDHSLGSNSFWRYAASEAPRHIWHPASSSTHANFHRRSLRMTTGQQSVFANAAFQQWSPNQTVFTQPKPPVFTQPKPPVFTQPKPPVFTQQKPPVQGGIGVGMLGAVEPDEDISWLSQVKGEKQELRRHSSYSPSVVSMEMGTDSPSQTVLKQQKHTMQGGIGVGMLGAVEPDEDMSWLSQVKGEKQELRRHSSYSPSVVSMEMGTDSPSQTVLKQQKHTMQGGIGVGMLGAVESDEDMTWLSQVKGGEQGLRKQSSYSPSVASMEMGTGRMMENELPIQQIQPQNVMTLKSENKPPEMTIERAVNLLTQHDEETLISAAIYIQNQSTNNADAKKKVYYLHGVRKLLQLLDSDNEEVQRAAAGALRNVVYQSSENKMEVKENNGLATILRVVKSSPDVETRRQLTGLLWNLSSHELLKEHLSREVLSVLTQSVLVPSSGISEGENPKHNLLADDEVFHNATGCLRNLSCAGPFSRKAMRDCENLIDSVVYYIRGTIADYKTDDKSTENCACILHNLSYQIEAECPRKYMREVHESRQNLAPKSKTVGCFAYRSAKITEHLEQQGPLLEEKANPRGIEWLWNAITIRMYLSLLACSVRPCTQEAAMGALQNITAGNGAVTKDIVFMVQRENGLQHVKKMLQEGESDVKRIAVSLVQNLSRYQELHADIVKQVLPEVVEMLPNDDTGTDLPSEVTASLLHILINLSQNTTEHIKDIIKHQALPKIINISRKDNGDGPTRAGQAACILLHTMWKHSDLHRTYKKCGHRKVDFINVRTKKVVYSYRD